MRDLEAQGSIRTFLQILTVFSSVSDKLNLIKHVHLIVVLKHNSKSMSVKT